ncbi:4a-hydroxytetrahydrobiopterin dehydratase [Halopolyspora algeriensis]|uniref:Putative pterin-4-alpha-carbinolamine dehydratase n=1 Tax=Halopolyspora algeriensis TaxID=1500506 RepID=A0A368VS26_9ACTN|nr:4a-hydroxytetrahydrobiopterin dehydratase [Halopolyspora algeriensis]RCW44700.1 4a-hydroxytetrahydrobiopterin dehydratase [Halopolyspora algeriensis]TQM56057.1 4a-hydroxytetrahydrobiopterin dehydratase [Halopolyspora algeriensis]
MPELLDRDTIDNRLTELPEWEYSDGVVRKTWRLKGFLATMTFANAIAHLANEANHHPDLSVHDYNHLTVRITTHSAGGVTENDLGLADRIEALRATP